MRATNSFPATLGVFKKGSTSSVLHRAVAAPLITSRGKHEINVPDWGHYKREPAEDGEVTGRAFSYMVIGSVGVGYASAAKNTVIKLLDSMNPAANVRALANVEVDLSNIPEGSIMTIKWRGKPLFIRHRTPQEIAESEAVPLEELRDAAPDDARRKADKPEWLIVLGVCTHLGCVPLGGQGEYGGWFCPCHGSHYDNAGRIRKGPAPLNLDVPPYVFKDDSTVVVGVDTL